MGNNIENEIYRICRPLEAANREQENSTGFRDVGIDTYTVHSQTHYHWLCGSLGLPTQLTCHLREAKLVWLNACTKSTQRHPATLANDTFTVALRKTKFKLSELRDQLDKRPRSLSVGSRFDEEVYQIMPPCAAYAKAVYL